MAATRFKVAEFSEYVLIWRVSRQIGSGDFPGVSLPGCFAGGIDERSDS